MKYWKKFLSVALALVMVLALAAPAFASENTVYTITINETTPDHEYDAYQIFKGSLAYKNKADGTITATLPANADLGDYNRVLSDIVWGSGITEAGKQAIINYLNLKDKDDPSAADPSAADVAEAIATQINNAEKAAAFAALLGTDGYMSTTPTASSTPKTTGTDEDTKVENYTINVGEAGYYLLVDKAGTQNGENAIYSSNMLEVVSDVSVDPKTDIPTPDKELTDPEVIGHAVGEEFNYAISATLPNNYASYTKGYKLEFEDQMSLGMEYVETVKVELIRDGETIEDLVLDTDYTFTKTAGDETKGEGDKIVFSFADLKGENTSTVGVAQAGDVIKITYTVKLNEKAPTEMMTEIPNAMKLIYSNNPNTDGEGSTTTTPEVVVPVYTFNLDITKVDGNDTNTKLSGAEFKLYRLKDDGSKEYAKVAVAEGTEDTETEGDENTSTAPLATGTVIEWVTEDEGTVLTSNNLGKVAFYGLGKGTYYLEEVEAPDGYNKLAGPIKVTFDYTTKKDTVNSTDNREIYTLATVTITVEQDGKETTYTYGDGYTEGNGQLGSNNLTTTLETDVANYSGSTLPSTGGIGTTIFYVVGGLLVVGAVVLLITKRRTSVDDE